LKKIKKKNRRGSGGFLGRFCALLLAGTLRTLNRRGVGEPKVAKKVKTAAKCMAPKCSTGFAHPASRCGGAVTAAAFSTRPWPAPRGVPPARPPADSSGLRRSSRGQLLVHVDQQHALAQRAPGHQLEISAVRPSISRGAAVQQPLADQHAKLVQRLQIMPRIRTGRARPFPGPPPARGAPAITVSRSISSGATAARGSGAAAQRWPRCAPPACPCFRPTGGSLRRHGRAGNC
jgi:hypothetical protein